MTEDLRLNRFAVIDVSGFQHAVFSGNHEEGNCVSPAIDEDDRRKCALLWARLEEKSNDALTTEQAIAALQNGRLNRGRLLTHRLRGLGAAIG